MDQFVPPSSEFTVPVSHPSLSHSHSTQSLHSIASDLFASGGPPSTRSQLNAAAAVGWESYVAELGKDKVTQLSSNARPVVPISVKPKTKEPEEFTDNRIYVSNIPFSFREIDLANMFTPYGRVVNVEIVMNERGSKGFGFVTLDNREGCERARRELHGCHVQGRIIEESELINFYSAVPFSIIYFRSKSTDLPDVTWLQRVISREVERQAQEQQRRAYDHVVTQLMAGLVRTGQIQGEIHEMQHSDLHSLQLPYTGLTPSSPLRRSPPRTAPCSPFIRSDYVSSSPVHPVHSAAVSHSASAFMFPPPLSVHSQQPWMNPVPLHSTSVSNPWPQPMESARSESSRAESTLSAAAEATISPVEKTEQGEETFVMQNVLDALPEINGQMREEVRIDGQE
ncbi:hypothetical protein WR25_26971 [Diploscapter pachys]|uniref:RRM domain-containing protein n=1 Tax=Diploscapter pachys TaxID=2018661 RepID=A0A2A2KM17_9BILA|nr:hypothetical protein WR25_26971 [Diploscapter pachys]